MLLKVSRLYNVSKLSAAAACAACKQGATCRCLPGFVSNLVGPAACGPAISPNSNASDAAALAAQLCDTYASYYEKMMQVREQQRVVPEVHCTVLWQVPVSSAIKDFSGVC